MKYPPHILDQIKTRLSLVEEVRRTVPGLKKKGKYWWACCPFHSEKSPSFHVRDEGNYYCFGCGASGDIITFTMETQGLDFTAAIKSLAQRAGVTLPEPAEVSPQAKSERENGFKALERAAVFFQRQLAGSPAEGYLRTRGVSPQAVADFAIGYAPAEWSALANALATEGFKPDVLRQTGLTSVSEKGRGDYDRFRNRLMFPIHDAQGRVVAFGGRVMDAADKGPKYLNSPDTPFFSKSHLLFNFHRAKPTIRQTQQALLVEGYMDVVAIHQAGLGTAVAPMGTAVTVEQLQLLWQNTPTITVCLDGDSAGRRAALRAAERALEVLEPGKTLQFVWLPDGEDPDSLLKKDGLIGFQQLLARPTSLENVLWEHLTAGADLTTAHARAEVEAAMAALLAGIKNQTLQRAYRQTFKDRIFAATRGQGRGPRAAQAPQQLLAPASYTPAVQADMPTRTMLALCLRWPSLMNAHLELLGHLQPPAGELADFLTALLRALAAGTEAAQVADTLQNGLFTAVTQDLLRSTGVAGLPADANPEELFTQHAHQWHARQTRTTTRKELLKQLQSGQLTAESWQSLQQQLAPPK